MIPNTEEHNNMTISKELSTMIHLIIFSLILISIGTWIAFVCDVVSFAAVIGCAGGASIVYDAITYAFFAKACPLPPISEANARRRMAIEKTLIAIAVIVGGIACMAFTMGTVTELQFRGCLSTCAIFVLLIKVYSRTPRVSA